jgi:hypothetical protein
MSLIIWASALGTGFSALSKYRHLSPVSIVKPSREILEKIKNITEPVFIAKVKKQKDFIELRHAKTYWKGRLDRPYSIFVNRSTGQTFFLRAEDYSIAVRGKLRPNKQQKVRFQIRDSDYNAVMGPISWQRYESWK